MSFLIRLATVADIDGMLEVRRVASIKAYVGGDITEKDINANNNSDKAGYIKDRMADGSMTFWVAESSGQIVGVCCAHSSPRANRIWFWYILPDFQARGIGRKLWNKALAHLGRSRDVEVEVASKNTSLLKHYNSLGFERISEGVWRLETGKEIPEIVLRLPAID